MTNSADRMDAADLATLDLGDWRTAPCTTLGSFELCVSDGPVIRMPHEPIGILPELAAVSAALASSGIEWDRDYPSNEYQNLAESELSDDIRALASAADTMRARGLRPLLRNMAAALNMRPIGQGCFGTCLDVSRYFTGRAVALKVTACDDDSYPLWIEWCRQNPHPSVPEVLACGWYGRMFWVLTPKYQAVDQGRPVRELDDDGWGAVVEQASVLFRDICDWDLHAGNIMWDKHRGRYIITDPLASLYTDREEALTYVRGLSNPQANEVAA